MSSFTSQPWFEPVPDSKFWIVRREFTYHITSKYGKYKVIIPFGFKTDFASVPRLFWWLVSPWGRHGKAAVVHDRLYQSIRIMLTDPLYKSMFDYFDYAQKDPRKFSDDIFLEAMGVLEVKNWRKYPMYWAVRLFGWFAWQHKQVPDRGA